MAWNKRLTQLNDALSLLIPFANNTLPFLERAEINYGLISFEGGSLAMWYNILSYANNNNQVDSLVNILLEKYPKNPHLLSYKESAVVLQEYDLGKDIKGTEWKEPLDESELEKITGGVSTFLPIRFLTMGIDKAKAVARVVISRGQKNELGSGFLLRNNYFITNNHVIKDIQTAGLATIQFNYEESIDGNPFTPTEFKCLPGPNNFFTSKENDYTIVKLDGDANADFGFVELSSTAAGKGDFVNIIQHPGGRYKQIALYHNMIMYADDNIVQYLTDTEPGSSGSPVFNSNWEVVALHNSGGTLVEPGTTQRYLRNQGINIKHLRSFINEQRLM